MLKRPSRNLVVLLVIGMTVLTGASPALAATVQIPAVTFVPRGTAPNGDVTLGLLANGGQAGTFYAPVTLTTRVCSLSLWARDNDNPNNVTARLVRKQRVDGAGTGFGPSPQVMAEVSTDTVGGSNDLQKLTDGSVVSPAISAGYLYWVEIEFSGGFLEALSVQIITKATC
jgi:hypothetical protein